VFLTYVSPRGRALIDRELYLPEHSWCADRDRCRQAGIDDEVVFATKPELARRMLDAGADIEWFTADEAYGDNPCLRDWLAVAGLNILGTTVN
jgi:SRSO17 transposase